LAVVFVPSALKGTLNVMRAVESPNQGGIVIDQANFQGCALR
jgi:hypothetical protein